MQPDKPSWTVTYRLPSLNDTFIVFSLDHGTSRGTNPDITLQNRINRIPHLTEITHHDDWWLGVRVADANWCHDLLISVWLEPWVHNTTSICSIWHSLFTCLRVSTFLPRIGLGYDSRIEGCQVYFSTQLQLLRTCHNMCDTGTIATPNIKICIMI